MILETGDIWSVFGKSDLWLFTGNSYITKKDELVMGRGLAKEVKDRYAEVPKKLVERIQRPRLRDSFETKIAWSIYGVTFIPFEFPPDSDEGFYLGVFQVKRHFKDKAELSLIGHSVLALQNAIRQYEFNRVDLNRPGVGWGALNWEHVYPIVAELPDCVHIWTI